HQQKGMISLSPPTICNSALFFAKQPFHWQLLRLEFALKLSHVKVCPYGTRRLLTKHYIVEHIKQIAYTME
ncbi:hypothetical protein, partial [Acinetobacter baumannii]|uniref:hypothetical protein n=1 Tax=Acinetobacter baumannii TaxID=470 RepID=UPI002810259C